MFSERPEDRRLFRDGDFRAVVTSTGGMGTATTTSSTYGEHTGEANEMVVDFTEIQNLPNVEALYVGFRGTAWLSASGTTGRVRIKDVTNGTSLTSTEVTATNTAVEAFQSPNEQYNPGGTVRFRLELKVDDGATTFNVSGNPNVIVYAKIDDSA